MTSADVKPASKKRFAPIIEARLNDHTIPELVWVDKGNKIFRIPWRHHKSAKWGDPEAFMLRELAKDMYKYNGPDIPTKKDLSDWKGLLRNNLKTLSDFEELPERHVLEGAKPFKVYCFVSNGAKHSKDHKYKTTNKCQGQKNQCRRNDMPVATDRSSEIVVSGNIPNFLDAVFSHEGALFSHAGICVCGNAACDIMSSSQESVDQDNNPCMVSSGTSVSNGQFSTIRQQDDQDDIFEELFQNNDKAFHQTIQFDVDVLNNICGQEWDESRKNISSSSGNAPYVNGGELFLDDSSVQSLSSMSSTGLEPCHTATKEYVNVSSSQESVCQQRRPNFERSFASEIDSSFRQGFDQDDLSNERFLTSSQMIYQQANQCNTSALQCDIFYFDSDEPKTLCNSFRSRSPLTTDIVPNPAASTSDTSSSCNTTSGKSTQCILSNRENHNHSISTNGVVCNNTSQEAASVFHGMDYDIRDNNTEASHDTCMMPRFAETLVHSDLVTAEGTSSSMANDIAISGFSHRTFLSLTRMLSVRDQMCVGVEVSYYNSPCMQPRMMPAEFRICFVTESDVGNNIASNLNEDLTVLGNVDLLELPPAQNCPRLGICQIKITNKVLHNLSDGILVSFRNGHIYATRYCRAGTLFSVYGRTDWQKLDRLMEVKIFDYNDYKHSFFSRNQAPIAQPFVRLSFAAKDPKKTVSVLTVDIWHMEALILARQTEENTSSLEPDLSLSDDFSEILRIGEMLGKTSPLPV